MWKRSWFFDFVTLVVVGSLLLFAYLGGNLRTSILNSQPKIQSDESTTVDCAKMSEDAANDCYRALAQQKGDPSLCHFISKETQKKACLGDQNITR